MPLTIILVAPVRAENVGAAARAMKTMGFSELRIVDSDAHRQPAAGWVAHGAGEIVQQATEYASLQQAVADMDFVVATTARGRGKYRYYCTPQELQPMIQERQQWCQRIALVFGREDAGLTNDELALADLLTTIPMQADYPSLNLGQAVMLYCYQLSGLHQSTRQEETVASQATEGSLQVLRQRVSRLLQQLALTEDRTLHDWLDQRLGYLQKRDVALLHTLLQDIDKELSS
ncbi:MAG: tRNA/rRNA methyltransferase [Enterobacteriaceae bacterium]